MSQAAGRADFLVVPLGAPAYLNVPLLPEGESVKLICVEEHMMHQEIAKAAHPALEREAPYMMLAEFGQGGFATTRSSLSDAG